jgi:hypothetical protein
MGTLSSGVGTPTVSAPFSLYKETHMPTKLQFKAFFARKAGRFTIQDQTGASAVFQGQVLKRIKALSGQRAYQNTSWISGQSPIPYSKETQTGKLYLHTKAVVNPEGMFSLKGIGRAYHISSSPNDPTKVIAIDGIQTRTFIMLHPDNMWAGSAGCIVTSWVNSPTTKKQTQALFAFLDSLHKQGINYIELEVL